MAECGWQPTERARISWALSNGSNPERWLLEYMFRWYVEGAAKDFQRLVTFFICFDPTPVFDHAIIVAAAARFPASARYENLVNRWKDTDPVIEALKGRSGLAPLTSQQFSKFLPSASHVTGMIVPLCRLTSTDALRSLCVEPMLDAARTLGQ
jgi:hypothetical protein